MPSAEPSPLQQSNEQRVAPRVPKALPKAPQSEAVAKRLLYHSTIRPVQRFDSADFFLDQHYAKTREAAAADEAADEVMPDTEAPSDAVHQPATDASWQQQLQTPPLPQRSLGQQP